MYHGYTGNILRVDLSTGVISRELLDMQMAEDFIGGRGLASRLLCQELDPAADALGP